ncbi:MAG: ribonuclease H-like domain-containing protein [Chloroflexota bacterium]
MPDAPFCVLDIETSGGDITRIPEGFRLLLAGVREGDAYMAFTDEPESLAQLAAYLADFPGHVVTFNGDHFDLPVLERVLAEKLGVPLRVPGNYDLMAEVVAKVGHRISLDRLSNYTFGAQKVPWDHKRNAWVWEHEPHLMVDYNRVDLDLTHELFARVLRGEPLFLGDATGVLPIPALPGAAPASLDTSSPAPATGAQLPLL